MRPGGEEAGRPRGGPGVQYSLLHAASKLAIPFRETSARLTTNVTELFQDLLDRILFPADPTSTDPKEPQPAEPSPETNEREAEPLKVKKLME